MKPITLTEILNLDDDLNNYHNRVQQRFDYIQAQLAMDPNFVAYDVLEYVGSKADSITQYKYIVGTDGSFYSQDRYGNWRTLIPKHKGGSVIITVKLGTAKTAFSLTRAIASTFIPKPLEYSEYDLYQLSAIGTSEPRLSTTRWISKEDNTQLKKQQDPEAFGIKPVLGTIVLPGPFKGQCFQILGSVMFSNYNINRGSVLKCINGDLNAVSGCTWRYITDEEKLEYRIGVPEGYMEYLEQNKELSDPRVKPVKGTYQSGHFKGESFYLLGKSEIEKSGFTASQVHRACHGPYHVFNGVYWEWLEPDDIGDLHRGVK